MMKTTYRFSITFFTALLIVGLTVPSFAKTSVFVSILPQKYFTEKIGGELVDVSVMVTPGGSPATYEPSPRQMTKLTEAKAYLAIGVPFENAWLPRIANANRSMPIMHVDKGITKLPMQAHGHHGKEEHPEHEKGIHEQHGEEEHHDHDKHDHEEHGHDEHGHHEAHHHGMLDPHVWLAPNTVKIVAQNTCAALSDIDPANKQAYRKNLDAFLKEIAALDTDIQQILVNIPHDKRTFMVFHPSWGYFAHQYHLNQIAIEAEGKEPSPKALANIIEHGRELHIPVVFVQPQFSKRSAQVIAQEIGATVIPLNPLAEDWASNLRQAAGAFGKALK